MNSHSSSSDSSLINVSFSLSSPSARSVSVAIFFNRWSDGLPSVEAGNDGESVYRNHQMVKELVRLTQVKPGQWQAETPLAMGWHEYLFLVDGTWVMDPAATNVCPNDAGEFSAVRIVSPVEVPNMVRRPSAIPVMLI